MVEIMALVAHAPKKFPDMGEAFGGFPGRAGLGRGPADGLDLNGDQGGEGQYGQRHPGREGGQVLIRKYVGLSG
jgi:hypothetical protein